MMDCEKIASLLDQYLDGTLAGPEAIEVEKHLEQCEDCACFAQMCKDLQAEEAEAVPEGFSAVWRAKIRKEEHMEKQQKKKQGFRAWMAVAAAFVFIVSGTLLTRDTLGKADGAPVAEAGGAGAIMYNYSSRSAPVANGMAVEEASADFAAPMMKTAATADTAAGGAQQRQDMIIRTADFTIKTIAFDATVEQIQNLTAQMNGHVDYFSQYNTKDELRNANFTLRIPADQLDAFLSDAENVGDVSSFTTYVDDVSDQYYDLDSRLETQLAKMERLQALLAQATDVSDLIEIESSIADTQYMIDSYTGQMQGIEGRVAYSTVSVYVQETRIAETKEATLGQRIGAGVQDALQGGLRFVQDALVFIVSVLPYVAVIAVVVVVVVIIRKAKKK